MGEASEFPPGFEDVLNFRLSDALFGRKARRFFMGASIPDGYFKYTSKHEAMPLSEIEQMTLLTAMGGNTGWQNLIMRAQRYAPYLSNYAGSAGSRTFPSAAGFHTSELFFTDDDGVYILRTRDAPEMAQRKDSGTFNPEELLEAHRSRIHKIYDGRLELPAQTPHVEAHNTWVVNHPGTTLVIPAGDLAQHVLAGICYYVQNGVCFYDDVNGEKIDGIEQFSDIVDTEEPYPITFLEMWSLSELTAELSTSCYAGMLILQAMGLGGWMFNGIDPFSVLGASGDPQVKGLGFRYDTDERWPLPNPTGIDGVFEAFTPPHYRDMRHAVDTLMERKFGTGGPFNPETPGYYKDTPGVRSSAQIPDEHFRECVALHAQYIYDTFGKFPGTVPSIFVMPYLQAQHLDLEFYDRFYEKGAYLKTHAEHMQRWHPDR
ncbi:hypothetical protein [Methanolobus halotolerans]|uniref:Uncharacterized protein n=1 Tax=Methanolobus halotolerans TaxID=2052935 RepID=A0A4E0Q5A4_9EURY|nr:hypothetical protein [Methanolobus halotolerans]TGC09021.1 hypothetical protein CUN85_08310 [Methanolobus halotolerans]